MWYGVSSGLRASPLHSLCLRTGLSLLHCHCTEQTTPYRTWAGPIVREASGKTLLLCPVPSFSPSLLSSCQFPCRPSSDPQAHVESLLGSLGAPPPHPHLPWFPQEPPDTSPLGSLGPPAPLLRFPRSPWHHTAAPWPYLPWFPREPLTLPRVLWDPQHLCSGSPGAPGATLLPPCPQALRASGAFPGSRLLFGPKSKVLFLDVGLPEPGTLPCSSLDMVGALLIQSGPWDSPEQAPGGPLLSWV